LTAIFSFYSSLGGLLKPLHLVETIIFVQQPVSNMDGFNEYQTSILSGESYIQNIAKLELLLLQKEKMDRRNPYDLVEYESKLRSELRVPSSVLGDLLLNGKKTEETDTLTSAAVKEEALQWMIQYTDDPASAVAICCFAVNLMKYFKGKINGYYKTHETDSSDISHPPSS
jgi:hypothetical protein